MDNAVIGKYASDKLIITEFDVDRTNVRTIQNGMKRKTISYAKQSVSINLTGYLVCTSFNDLEIEKDKLLEALNEPELKLVIGHRPGVYWLVSWNDSDLAHKANNGGYVLPISLNFEGLEESAVAGIPASKGYATLNNQCVSTTGSVFKNENVATKPAAILCAASTPATSPYVYITAENFKVEFYKSGSTAYANLRYNNAIIASLSTTLRVGNAFGVSFDNGYVVLHLDGLRKAVVNASPRPKYVMSSSVGKLWEVELDFSPLAGYCTEVIASMTASSVIKLQSVTNGQQIVTVGNAPAPASLVADVVGACSISINNFGFMVLGGKHTYVFNNISSVIEEAVNGDIEGIQYLPGKATLFPTLNQGSNDFTGTGNGTFTIAWQERYY